MNKGESYLSEGVVFGLLVVLGVLTRLACEAMPNVAPTAAIALFAGFYFRRAWLALAAPLVVMGVSDCFIGGYETVTMLCVYGGLAFPVLLRGWLKRRVKLAGGDARAVMSSSLQIGLCAVIGSLVFFTVSNFGCWLAWGEPTRFRSTADTRCRATCSFAACCSARTLWWPISRPGLSREPSGHWRSDSGQSGQPAIPAVRARACGRPARRCSPVIERRGHCGATVLLAPAHSVLTLRLRAARQEPRPPTPRLRC